MKKQQYVSPTTGIIDIKTESCLLENSVTSTSGTTHEIEISSDPVDKADSRKSIWDEKDHGDGSA